MRLGVGQGSRRWRAQVLARRRRHSAQVLKRKPPLRRCATWSAGRTSPDVRAGLRTPSPPNSGELPTPTACTTSSTALGAGCSFARAKSTLEPAAGVGDCRRAGVQAVRGPVRDAITVFDENAALLLPTDALWSGRWPSREWADGCPANLRPMAAEQRAGWALSAMRPLEKLVAAYKAITAHVWRDRRALGFPGRNSMRGWRRT
ncbi:MAG: DUF3025 domain-containing protein [Comamonadaceae bacterium]|nr:DUF3025 domain-containing protein [Comamonadaceae bacterium]